MIKTVVWLTNCDMTSLAACLAVSSVSGFCLSFRICRKTTIGGTSNAVAKYGTASVTHSVVMNTSMARHRCCTSCPINASASAVHSSVLSEQEACTFRSGAHDQQEHEQKDRDGERHKFHLIHSVNNMEPPYAASKTHLAQQRVMVSLHSLHATFHVASFQLVA